MYQWLVYSLSTSKYSPYKDADTLWDMPWGEFVSVLEWVNFSLAQEYAMTKDAHSTEK